MSLLQRATTSWLLQRSLVGRVVDETPWSRPRDVAGLTIAITGASSGIGAASARRLARRGAHVIAIARDEAKLREVAADPDAGGRIEVLPADLTDEADTQRVIDALNERRIDVLVNNAGRSIRRTIRDSTHRFHDFQRTMEINYFGAVRLTLGVLDPMIERGGGQVINVTTWALLPRTMPKFSAYGASKAALEIFSRSLAAELGPSSSISTSTLYYPLVRTDMIAPTAKYADAGALTESEAAEWMEYAIRHRPVRVQPNIMKIAPLMDMAVPQAVDRITRRGA